MGGKNTNEYINLNKQTKLTNEMKIFPGRFLGKYVTFETKFRKIDKLHSYRSDILTLNGAPFPIDFSKCCELSIDGVNGEESTIGWLIYDLSQGEWVFDLKGGESLIVKGYISYFISVTLLCLVTELKRKDNVTSKRSNTRKTSKINNSKLGEPVSSATQNVEKPIKRSNSKYRKKLKEYFSAEGELKEVDFLVDKNKTTHKVIYECLYHGLTLDETWFLIEKHRTLSIEPTIISLRILFLQLEKDAEMLDEAIDFIEENHSLLYESICPNVEWYSKDSHLLSEFIKLLKRFNNSMDDLKMYIHSYEWDQDEYVIGDYETE